MTDFLPDAVPISERARRFAEEYCIDFRTSRAEAAAGLMPGAGSALLKDPRIDALIREHKRKASERVQISIDSTLETFRLMRDIQITDYFAGPGSDASEMMYPLKPLAEWTIEMRLAVKSIKWTKFGPQLELHDKLAANTAIAKYYGLLVDKTDVRVTANVALETIDPTMTPQRAAEIYQQQIGE